MIKREFKQFDWDKEVDRDCRAIVRLAIAEDLADAQDWTSVALVPADRQGAANVVTRESGVVAGMKAISTVIEEMSANLTAEFAAEDGDAVKAQARLVTLRGNVRDVLTVERTLLNLVSRLMGVATLANRFASEVRGTAAQVYDTRKTTPGWRRLEKYAVHCGGAANHRMGLYDAILIKDNHLAQRGRQAYDVAEAVRDAQTFVEQRDDLQGMVVQVEVDTLAQLEDVLPARPDIVLLDNMEPALLIRAVTLRDKQAPEVQLEASGGVDLQTVREIAMTGVERISVGALTHSACSLDIGLDWHAE
ncbi:MAG: carboxylating nicotinate-nucleotide diphosphorylase [Planctomycetota bacterium]